MRKKRKDQHIEAFRALKRGADPLFDDVLLANRALPDMSLDQVDTRTDFLGQEVPFPLMINAITGGTEAGGRVNRDLARLARDLGLPLALGSQALALEDREARKSYILAREVMGPGGLVISNLGGNHGLEDAKRAVEMLDADALQIHLNPGQELAMAEGDRDFRGVLEKISEIVEGLGLPVIVKEVGLGLSTSDILDLYKAGVRYVDVAGRGGTNFIEIEGLRREDLDLKDLSSWGIPTSLALVLARGLGLEGLVIIGSGGIKTSLDLTKALVLGADMGAVAGPLLRRLLDGGLEGARTYLEEMIYKTRILMVMAGARDLKALREVPWLAKGDLKDYLDWAKTRRGD